jgi:hypothetical protein
MVAQMLNPIRSTLAILEIKKNLIAKGEMGIMKKCKEI